MSSFFGNILYINNKKVETDDTFFGSVTFEDQCGLTATDLQKVQAQFRGLLWYLPCTFVGFPGTYGACECPPLYVDSFTVDADPLDLYEIAIRVRGISEYKDYTGGVSAGSGWYVGGVPGMFAEGYNIYKLEISDPPQLYYLNEGNPYDDPPLNVWDYTETIQVRGGATVTLTADVVVTPTIPPLQIPNPFNVSAPNNDPLFPIRVAQPFNGQFMQLDGVTVTLL